MVERVVRVWLEVGYKNEAYFFFTLVDICFTFLKGLFEGCSIIVYRG